MDRMSDCIINPYSSGVCVLGTKSCMMKHTGIVERDKQIKELEDELDESVLAGMELAGEIRLLKAEIERLKRGRDRLIETQEELIEENKRLTSAVCTNPIIQAAQTRE